MTIFFLQARGLAMAPLPSPDPLLSMRVFLFFSHVGMYAYDSHRSRSTALDLLNVH